MTSLRRFGFHAQPTSLVIAFDGPLDPFSAQDTANYQVAGPVSPRGRGIQIDPVIAALYDATNHTVTLSLRDRLNLHLRYHLTIVGTPPDGVSNAQAIFLDGSGTGHPGTDFETIFGREILAGPARTINPGRATPAGRRPQGIGRPERRRPASSLPRSGPGEGVAPGRDRGEVAVDSPRAWGVLRASGTCPSLAREAASPPVAD